MRRRTSDRLRQRLDPEGFQAALEALPAAGFDPSDPRAAHVFHSVSPFEDPAVGPCARVGPRVPAVAVASWYSAAELAGCLEGNHAPPRDGERGRAEMAKDAAVAPSPP